MSRDEVEKPQSHSPLKITQIHQYYFDQAINVAAAHEVPAHIWHQSQGLLNVIV